MGDYADRIKLKSRTDKTGAFTQDISFLQGNYNLFGIVLERKSGVPITMKMGTAYNGQDVMRESDISWILNYPRFIELNKVFSSQTTLYGKIASGVFDVDFIFIQRKE